MNISDVSTFKVEQFQSRTARQYPAAQGCSELLGEAHNWPLAGGAASHAFFDVAPPSGDSRHHPSPAQFAQNARFSTLSFGACADIQQKKRPPFTRAMP